MSSVTAPTPTGSRRPGRTPAGRRRPAPRARPRRDRRRGPPRRPRPRPWRRRARWPPASPGATSTGSGRAGRSAAGSSGASVTSTLRVASASGLNTTMSTVRPRPPMSPTEGQAPGAGGEPGAGRRGQLPGPRRARRRAGRDRTLVQQHALDHHRLPVRRADDGGVGHAGLDALLPAVVDDLEAAGSDAQAERLRCRTVAGGHGAHVDLGPLLAGVVDHDALGGDQRGPVVAGIGDGPRAPGSRGWPRTPPRRGTPMRCRRSAFRASAPGPRGPANRRTARAARRRPGRCAPGRWRPPGRPG